MDETAILSKRREDAVINASLHPSIPSLPSSTPVQQFISDIPPGFLPLNVCPYIGVPSGGFNPTPDTIGTTPGYMSLSHLSPTRANQEPMQLALPSDKQLIEFCAANPWWSLPTSLPLDLPLQDIATMFPISHDDAFTTSQDNSFKEPHQSARSPSPIHTRPVLRCKWKGCDGSHCFKREGDLMRHIRTIHVSPGSYPCLAKGCTRVFGRKDHLIQHTKRRHGTAKPQLT